MSRTRLPSIVTGSTKLRGAQRSPELAFRSTDFRVPENLICPALFNANFVLLSFSSYRSIEI